MAITGAAQPQPAPGPRRTSSRARASWWRELGMARQDGGCITMMARSPGSVGMVQAEIPFVEPEDIHQVLLYAATAAEVTTLPLRQSA
ncbi:MAG: hypothetical protein ACRDTG_12830 [Pseudonocardiaceae bacterium]